MRKLIFLAIAGYVWKKFQSRSSRPRIITDLSSTPVPPRDAT